MSLQQELHLVNPIQLKPHEVLLSIYHSASCIKKEADSLFRQFNLTDLQFNLMMLLRHQVDLKLNGINQAQLSRMMLVNRANITSLIDRMEKAGLVKRTSTPNDRRSNIIQLTDFGNELLDKVEPEYASEILNRMQAFADDQQNELLRLLESVRKCVVVKRQDK